ncbi:RNA polymerase sigma factor [Dyadobacter fanqingshengii]|uniref:RNA polymerase subunit sigma n=1 Tax=Dyadobacter fanqingshengii TaxID=2906443 RepID=A0A9X1PA24_9BACT|nr:DUF6596 domain-containing protein [Dyadobacter fanqingshengii]MCF0040765.1 RNA polymerase subunit sigma [Dyadobacter fanqingshengii]USJ37499.1 RNA polymerase subunit sigma [Dyadobacter fanqingshengii]
MTNHEPIIPHLFRTEYRKIVSVLCRHFGFREIEIAEDIASETFQVAMQAWGLEGLPPNPAGWLYNTAKNKAKNYLHRESIFRDNIAPGLKNIEPQAAGDDIDLSLQNINDSQLQMMFAVCHPAISREAQIGLSLRILCGFGIDEIATAFVTNKEVINKRLFRAKEKLRKEKVQIELPPPLEIDARLEQVLTTIYLLFNEGYYSVSQNNTLRKELCLEAMRLCTMLIENPDTNKPQVNALLALMCFHASRFDARMNGNGEIILYDEQDSSLWNTDLINKGGYFLSMAAQGSKLSRYHLEAGIAAWHTQQSDSPEKWEGILHLYNQLLQREYSPVAALNRTYAVAKVRGKEVAIAEAERLNLPENHFYYALLGELYSGLNDDKARLHWLTALSLAKTDADKEAIRKKLGV